MLMLTPERVAGDNGSARGRIGAQARVPPDLFEGMRAEHRYGPVEAVGRYGPVEAVGEAVRKSWNMATLMLTMLGKMVVGDGGR
jgi:regulator of sigma E protease